MFFISQLISLFKWSNLDVFLSSLLINWLKSLEITGMFLIIFYFIIILLVSLLIPDSIMKWQIIAPVAVPLLMRANITANYTQFIFIVADGIGKSISVLFPYAAILFGLPSGLIVGGVLSNLSNSTSLSFNPFSLVLNSSYNSSIFLLNCNSIIYEKTFF